VTLESQLVAQLRRNKFCFKAQRIEYSSSHFVCGRGFKPSKKKTRGPEGD
jgi:hypothetical protein